MTPLPNTPTTASPTASPTISAEICRHPLDRVPLSLIVDDSAPLVNLNYFFLRDRIAHTGQHQRWEDVPVAIPESFTREWAEWCLENGVKGKYSVVPCPAAIGRIDRGLPLFGQQQLDSWLAMCRQAIVPAFDITPEMLTHTFALDLATLQPLPSRIWEQYEWQSFPEEDEALLTDYIALACQILANVDLPPEGVTSPGGFGGKVLPLYARITGNAVRRVTGNPLPYFFKQVHSQGRVDTPVWYADRESATAVGEVIACVGDWTGSWTGYGEADADRYITDDLQGGRLPEVIDAGDPCVLVSHWQGFYGMHDGDRRGFRVLQTLVERLRARDPHGEQTQWRRTSEITNYACARALAAFDVTGAAGATADAGASTEIRFDLPVRVPELTVRVHGLHGAHGARAVRCDGQALRRVASKRDFRSGTYWQDGADLLLAYDPQQRASVVEVVH